MDVEDAVVYHYKDETRRLSCVTITSSDENLDEDSTLSSPWVTEKKKSEGADSAPTTASSSGEQNTVSSSTAYTPNLDNVSFRNESAQTTIIHSTHLDQEITTSALKKDQSTKETGTEKHEEELEKEKVCEQECMDEKDEKDEESVEAVKEDMSANVGEEKDASKKVDKSNEADLEEDDDEGVFRDILNGHLDRYGFATTENSSSGMSAMSLARDRQTYWSKTETESQRKRRVRLENLRTQKWLRMLQSWDKEVSKKRKRLDRRVRKGVPDCFRDRVWPKLVHLHGTTAQTTTISTSKEDSFEVLLSKANRSTDPEMEKIRECISRDIGRTFPRHIIFHKSGGIGQTALTNVLRAYAALDHEVGYCQGMGFIVGLLLGYVPESQAFSIFRTLMLTKPWNMCELYKPGMPGSQLLLMQYEALLKQFVPDVAQHLEREMIVPSMYATQWFITVFTYNFPFDVVVRVWDMFLLEGWKVVHQVALAIMKKHSKEILSRKFEQILEYFRGIPPSLKPEELMDIALSIPISDKVIEKLRY